LEFSYDDRSQVLYTLKDEDHEGYISLYKRYMALGDPTEAIFAQTYFDGIDHWELLCRNLWFKPYVERWRKELDLVLRSRALANIMDVAEDKGHRSNYEANKYLLAGGWKTKEDKAKVGRPSKDEISRQAQLLFAAKDQTEEDYKRIFNN
jgi:hypothetical protein